ncbi:hypothetical protein [Bacillus velezensis]|uniref:hypothetical protein n=1 Tax=Bacillus velezensis TaxID=492670 RepID=UPI0021DA74D6|nr:hypothetical protein [Bacillus velezensis]MCU9592077.1 hypothetical protein [Bacillus velezensis]
MVVIKSHPIDGDFPEFEGLIQIAIEEGSGGSKNYLVQQIIMEAADDILKIIHQRCTTNMRYKTYLFTDELHMRFSGCLSYGEKNEGEVLFNNFVGDHLNKEYAKKITCYNKAEKRQTELNFTDCPWDEVYCYYEK